MSWTNYTDLMPTEEDVSRNLGWALRALLKPIGKIDRPELFVPGGPGAGRDLLLPYGIERDTAPGPPKITVPDGMFREALEDLKDGHDAIFKVDVHHVRKCACTGKRHRRRCPFGESILHAVTTLMADLQARARTPLALAPAQQGDAPLMVDDHDGMAPPTVRFRVVVNLPVAEPAPAA